MAYYRWLISFWIWSFPKWSSSSHHQVWQLRGNVVRSIAQSARNDGGRTRSHRRKHSQTMPSSRIMLAWADFTERQRCCLTLTRAANVNSRSSERKLLSSIAVSSASSSRSWFRNRYSVTPNQRRKSCNTLIQPLTVAGAHPYGWSHTGVEHIIWS